jgi:DMSO reductase anchor subunit
LGAAPPPPWIGWLATPAAAAAALVGVFCSIRIYQVTQREFWKGWRTSARFWLTAALLGSATALVCATLARAADGDAVSPQIVGPLTTAIVIAGVLKLICERAACPFHQPASPALEASTELYFRKLGRAVKLRCTCGLLGVILAPVVPLVGAASWALFGVSLVVLALCLVGELAERRLYFRAVVPLKMPGGIVA